MEDLSKNVEEHNTGNDSAQDVTKEKVTENFHSDENKKAHGGEKTKWPGWPGENVYRLLVPAQKIGGIIGRKGEFIKKIVEESKARIKILDGPPGSTERAVLVSAKEEPNSSLPPAVDGLLRVHKRILDGMEGDSSFTSPNSVVKVSTRLLVPAAQAGNLIGKQGGTVKSIQEASSCVVRILGSEELPVYALEDDKVVELFGDTTGAHKALELVACHLRKFLVDRSIIQVFEAQMQNVNHHVEQMPPAQPWVPPQPMPTHPTSDFGFPPNPSFIPPRKMDGYYPPRDLPPMEKPPHQGFSAYGRDGPLGGHSSAQLAPSVITQITQQMQIPLSYADAVIGTAGASISYIRRASGATVTIQEARDARGEMTVEISGTASQVQTAQQLIQNFMAEAPIAAAVQNQPVVSMGQSYNPYSNRAPAYPSPPSNLPHIPHASAYGGSAYGPNYGY